MSEKTEKQFSELWNQLKIEMISKGDVPEGSLPSKAETIMEMVGAMLMNDFIFCKMRCHYHDLLLPPHPNFGKMIEVAKQKGTFPQVVDIKLSGDPDEAANEVAN